MNRNTYRQLCNSQWSSLIFLWEFWYEISYHTSLTRKKIWKISFAACKTGAKLLPLIGRNSWPIEVENVSKKTMGNVRRKLSSLNVAHISSKKYGNFETTSIIRSLFQNWILNIDQYTKETGKDIDMHLMNYIVHAKFRLVYPHVSQISSYLWNN